MRSAAIVLIALYVAVGSATELPAKFQNILGLTHRNYANCRNEVMRFHGFVVSGYMMDSPELIAYLNTPFCRPVKSDFRTFGDIAAVFMGLSVEGKQTAPVDHAAILLEGTAVYEKPNSDDPYRIGDYATSIELDAAKLRQFGDSTRLPQYGGAAGIHHFKCQSPELFTHGFRDVDPSYKALWEELAVFEKSMRLPGAEFVTVSQFKSVAGVHFKDPLLVLGTESRLHALIKSLSTPRNSQEDAMMILINLRLNAAHMLPFTFQHPDSGAIFAGKPQLHFVNLESFNFSLDVEN